MLAAVLLFGSLGCTDYNGADSTTRSSTSTTAAGATLSGVLEALEANYAGIQTRILDDNGALRRFVNVYVGDEDVRFAEGLATATPAGTQISVIPAVAGG